jgi:hypothetical protein
MTQFQITEKVRELIQKSRIVSFATWQDFYPSIAIAIFQTADDQGRFLTNEDLQNLQQLIPAIADNIAIVKLLTDQASVIVDEARAQVLAAFPEITQEGGGLYPPERANACWRDFWHFLRCITYGIAGKRPDYLSAEGLQFMKLLYKELQVPIAAMILGLESVKIASLNRTTAEEKALLSPYFDCLINELQLF